MGRVRRTKQITSCGWRSKWEAGMKRQLKLIRSVLNRLEKHKDTARRFPDNNILYHYIVICKFRILRSSVDDVMSVVMKHQLLVKHAPLPLTQKRPRGRGAAN